MVPMWHTMSCFWSLCNSSSMYYILKRMGDNTPPWRTPLDTLMGHELVPFHVAFTICLVYISNTIIKITHGMFLFSNRWNNLGKLTLSKAFMASKAHIYIHSAASRGVVRNDLTHGSSAHDSWIYIRFICTDESTWLLPIAWLFWHQGICSHHVDVEGQPILMSSGWKSNRLIWSRPI